MHELWLVKGQTMTNITPLIGTITRRSNIEELGEELTFDIAYNDARFHPKNPCDLGDLVIFKNGDTEITRTIIVEEDKAGRNPINYTTFDYAFYLNKSSSIYQFKKMQADSAIRKICSDFGVPIGNIVSISTQIDKIFNNVAPSDIIKEILETAEQRLGTKYLMEMRQGKLYIEEQKDLLIKATFQLAKNLAPNDVTDAISNPSRTRSIVDMKNSIQVVGDDDKLEYTAEDRNSIRKYGKLQEVIQLDQEEKRSAKVVAQNELKKLNRIVEESSIELIGDDRIRAGRILELNEPVTGLKGKYLITDATHSISGGIHTVSVGLEVV